MKNDTQDELFNYTSGRWLYNESRRLQERHLTFDVAELTRIVAESVGRSYADVKRIRKLAEGGFNRSFEATMQDGLQVIARLPYPSTYPKRLSVASEVATMDLVRSHGIQVPRVHSYSSDPENAVGAEYIIMEKAGGKPLGDIWYALSEKERVKIITDVVAIEAKLFAIHLPAYGSVFFDQDLPDPRKGVPIALQTARGSLFVGPDTSLKSWMDKRSELDVDRGPHANPKVALRSVARKEIAWLEAYGKPRLPFDRVYREFTNYQRSQPEEHIQTLEKYLQIAPYLVPRDEWLHRPTIRHPDLQPNNIFVSEDLDILALIDWQHCTVLPLFLHAGIPNYFQNYGDQESENLVRPELPKDIGEMDEEDQEATYEQFRRRQLHFLYLGATAGMNELHFRACMHEAGLFRRRVFTHAGEPWEGNNIPLKADLVRITQTWSDLVVTSLRDQSSACPIAFGESEAKEYLNCAQQQEEADATMENLRGAIGISVDGWVSNERYNSALAQAAKIKKKALEYAENDFERAMTKAHWPFDDFDEKE